MPPYVHVTPATLRAQAAKEREAMQESEAELRIDRDCRVRLRCGFEGPVRVTNEPTFSVVPAIGYQWSDKLAWTPSGSCRGHGELCRKLDIVAIIDESAEAEAELAARHAGQENAGADEEEPAPEPIADLITGPGRFVTENGKAVRARQREVWDRDGFTADEIGGDETGIGYFPDGSLTYPRGRVAGLRAIAPIPASLSDAEAAGYAKLYAPLYAEAIGQGKTPEQAREYARERVERKAEPVVIDGPGEYEMLWDNEPCIGTVEYQRPDGKWFVTGYPNCFSGTAFFSDGAHYGRDDYPQHRIVRKHVPAPRLEEEIGEGLWWASGMGGPNGVRKVEVVKVPSQDGYAAAWSSPRPLSPDGKERHVSPVQADGRFGASLGIQLVRRVQQPTTRPYTRDELESLVGTKVRHKKTRNVGLVLGAGVANDGYLRISVADNSAAYPPERALKLLEHLDGSPCGVIEGSDPWDEPTG